MENQTQGSQNQNEVVVDIQEIKLLLKQGHDRAAIKAMKGWNTATAKYVFSQPGLKKLKVARNGNAINVKVIDSAANSVAPTPAPVATNQDSQPLSTDPGFQAAAIEEAQQSSASEEVNASPETPQAEATPEVAAESSSPSETPVAQEAPAENTNTAQNTGW